MIIICALIAASLITVVIREQRGLPWLGAQTEVQADLEHHSVYPPYTEVPYRAVGHSHSGFASDGQPHDTASPPRGSTGSSDSHHRPRLEIEEREHSVTIRLASS